MVSNSDKNGVKTAFLGLGVMGYPMAGHLAANGYDVCVYNRTASKSERWVNEHNGCKAATPADAVKDADYVFACVGNDSDVEEICCGDNGAYSGMKSGAVFVDHTTASAQIAKKLAQVAADSGLHFIDAPVSGGQAGAENGILTVMAGGDSSVFELVAPIMSSYGRAVTLMGPVGSGQLTKMVNQISIAGLLQGLSEALNFAAKVGLDEKLVLDVISKGAAQSWQMENRGVTMVDDQFEFGFAVDWMRKDLSICLGEANKAGARLPITALVDQFYAEIQAMGGNRWDTSSLIRLLRNP
ncbi:MAG: NAD(P)-dependent oxidoreductase [Acidiferrobacterales bacterium]|nr:NAD(P)-dependent oxidoreductase [Acidiferrobacterales bacterium]